MPAKISIGSSASYPLRLKEKDIQNTCVALLQLDGWRHIRLEQNFSERKRKTIGEPGMADSLFIRYACSSMIEDRCQQCAVMFIEWKRILPPARKPRGPWPRSTQASIRQQAWHAMERSRGALTLIAGVDFEASIEGFRKWYEASGLKRR